MDPLPGRPLPARPIAEVVRAWLQWFGLIRLVVIAIAVGAVGAGAYWLLRAPAAPIENTLPMASRASTTTVVETASTRASGDMSTSTTAIATAVPSGDAAGLVVVDVAGAVIVPGVYELAAGSRAHDAIEIAGGLAPDAEVDALNLAAPLRDGDRLYVPHRGVPVPTVIQPTGGSSATVGPSTPIAGPIDLNRATVAELDVLPGIGPATAAAIVAYREQVGPFAAVDDLLKVQGIGPAKLDAIRDLVVV